MPWGRFGFDKLIRIRLSTMWGRSHKKGKTNKRK